MSKKQPSKALAKRDSVTTKLSAAAVNADKEIKRSELWTFLGDVVQGTKDDFILGTSNQKGESIVGRPKLQDRIKAAELLLQYRYGRPKALDVTQARKPDEKREPKVKRDDLLDDVIAMMERAARLQRLNETVQQPAVEALPVGEAEEVDNEPGYEVIESPPRDLVVAVHDASEREKMREQLRAQLKAATTDEPLK